MNVLKMVKKNNPLSGGVLKKMDAMTAVNISLSVVGLVGLGNLSKLAYDENCTSHLNDTNRMLLRSGVLLLWLSVLLSFSGIVVSFKSPIARLLVLISNIVGLVTLVLVTQLLLQEKCMDLLNDVELLSARVSLVLVWVFVLSDVIQNVLETLSKPIKL
jgi:hypothetical protein